MQKSIWLAALAVLLTPALTMAQSVFDGTWTVDISTAKFPTKPEVFLLQNGIYDCKTCVSPVRVKADGMDHAIKGDPYADSYSVKVMDDRTVFITAKKNGKVVGTSKERVSADGNTLMSEFTNNSATNGATVTGKGEETRVAKGPSGSHAISGSWKMAKVDRVSENGLSFTMKVTGNELTMSSPTGQGYTAKLDGTEAAYHGDPGTTSVAVKKIGTNTVEEMDKRNSKVISVTRMTVLSGGNRMKISSDDKLRNEHSEIMATKQ